MIRNYAVIAILVATMIMPVTAQEDIGVEIGAEQRVDAEVTQDTQQRVDVQGETRVQGNAETTSNTRERIRNQAQEIVEIAGTGQEQIQREIILRQARSLLQQTNLELETVQQNEQEYRVVFRDQDNERVTVVVDTRTGEVVKEDNGEVTQLFRGMNEQGTQQVQELQRENRELQQQLRQARAELRKAKSLLEQNGIDAELSGEVEVQVRNQPPETSPRAENSQDERNNSQGTPNEQARESVNGTPGEDNSNRPGFVSRLLQGIFG